MRNKHEGRTKVQKLNPKAYPTNYNYECWKLKKQKQKSNKENVKLTSSNSHYVGAKVNLNVPADWKAGKRSVNIAAG